MKATKSSWLAMAASAAALVVFAYGGATLAQGPSSTPCGAKSPPGKWTPCVSYPFRHHHPHHSAPAQEAGKPRGPAEIPQGRRLAPTAAYTPSPEEQRELQREEEQTRKYGHITVEPPHPAKHWGTANGRPPERYHRTAPPTPSPGGA